MVKIIQGLKKEKLFCEFINILSVILFTWIMIMLIKADKIEYFYKVTLKINNIKLLITGLFIIVVTVFVHSLIKNKVAKIDSYKFIKIFSCIFCVI